MVGGGLAGGREMGRAGLLLLLVLVLMLLVAMAVASRGGGADATVAVGHGGGVMFPVMERGGLRSFAIGFPPALLLALPLLHLQATIIIQPHW